MSRCADGQKNRCKNDSTQYLDDRPVCTLHYNRRMRLASIQEWMAGRAPCTDSGRHPPRAWRIYLVLKRLYCPRCASYKDIPDDVWNKGQI